MVQSSCDCVGHDTDCVWGMTPVSDRGECVRGAGKLIVWGKNREEAMTRMKRCLDEVVIVGVPTTIPFHKLIFEVEAFKEGNVDTGFCLKHADELREPLPERKNMIADVGRSKSKSGARR